MTIPDLIKRKNQLKAELSEIDLMVDAAAMCSERAHAENEPLAFSLFKETTNRLLTEFCNAPNKMLSHEDIRQDVMFDPEAPDRNIRQTINRARKELREKAERFEIKNIRGKGYQLVRCETLHELPQTLCTSLKPRKNSGKRRNVG